MMRGAVVLVALPGDYGKPRPAVILQSDLFNDTHPSITLCPVTSDLRDAPLFRMPLTPSENNGLKKPSQLMIDKVQTVRRERLSPPIGHLTESELLRLNRSLMVFLGLPN